jgi:hypothetical protein
MEKIEKDRWYRPSEIAKLGFIKNSKGEGDYALILKFIKRGKLMARNFGLGKTPYFRVKGDEIIRYLEGLK